MQRGGSLKSHRSVLTPRSTLVCPSQFLGGFSFVLYVAFIIPCFGFCFFFSEWEEGLIFYTAGARWWVLGVREINYNSLKL